MESIKINKLEIENVKRVKAVKIEPTATRGRPPYWMPLRGRWAVTASALHRHRTMPLLSRPIYILC